VDAVLQVWRGQRIVKAINPRQFTDAVRRHGLNRLLLNQPPA
jgi:hypothetical protein